LQLTRRTSAEVYAFIESDLADAIAALPNQYMQLQKRKSFKRSSLCFISKSESLPKKWQKVVDNANLVTGYSLVPNYASMFRLAGENDAESIFEIQGNQFQGGYSNTQGALVLAVGDGVSTPSQSLVNAYEPGDVRKTPLLFFAGTTLYDGRVVPTTVETQI
jgi:hypothetical protein